MRTPTFLHGAVVAFVLCLLGGALAVVLGVFGPGFALRAVIATVAFAYVLYLVGISPARSGRASTLTLWLAAAFALWLWTPPLILFVLLHAVLIWLVRAFNHRRNLGAALADGVLVAIALIAGLWAMVQTGSLTAALWCFLLVQALHVLIPAELPSSRRGPAIDSRDRFARAHEQAEAAVRRLLTEH